jgi:hypothetical protein
MLRSLGLIVLRFSGLEFCAERQVYGFISDSTLGILVVAGQDMSWKLERLRAIRTALEPSDATEALKGWIEGVAKLNDRRNQLIHSFWTTGDNGWPVGLPPNKARQVEHARLGGHGSRA